jgi:protoporphyrinogen oxidase
MAEQRAVIIGAGPAGLTAAYELLTRTGIKPLVLEKDSCMGGISRTVNYKGNRMDIGGHRFFSKSQRVMDWWLKMLPLEEAASRGEAPVIAYHGMTARAGVSTEQEARGSTAEAGQTAAPNDRVMLLRSRKSRIYYLRRFFDYPITLSVDTLRKLGVVRTLRIGFSYIRSAMFPVKNERTLEQFLINRFGRELYGTFFQSYTEKVWGVPCNRIGAEWGAQRIKGLSITQTVLHAAKKLFGSRGRGDVRQKGTETSLIEQFLYPKFGPGQMWDEVARQITHLGGTILTGYQADRVIADGDRVRAVRATHTATGRQETFEGDYFFSTAPIQQLMRAFDPPPPREALEVSDGLVYRDFVTVGLLVRSLKIRDDEDGRKLIRDNWIYIQEPDVRIGRLQIFNNWSPFMVKDSSTVWLGLEYFCNMGDDLWSLSDEAMAALASAELSKIGIIDAAEALDSTVIRVEKTYPAYFGTYDRFAEIREYVDRYANLFLIGRNGMHRYNNQDHSMLTAMMAVDLIEAGRTDKAGLWEVNTEMEYHEEKDAGQAAGGRAPA